MYFADIVIVIPRNFEEAETGNSRSERRGSIPNIDRMRLARRRKSIPAYLGKTFRPLVSDKWARSIFRILFLLFYKRAEDVYVYILGQRMRSSKVFLSIHTHQFANIRDSVD